MWRILVTGSEGLIGGGLVPALEGADYAVRRFDVRAPADDARGDVLDAAALRRAVRGCCGVVHLAAVSRVVRGEEDCALCRRVNVEGTELVLAAARQTEPAPWVLYTSSREVYGQPDRLPADEDCAIAPVNAYGRAKAEAEDRVLRARGDGLRTAIARLSNVYGSTRDYPDRVSPAFARAAAHGGRIVLEGPDNTFDFTHLDDVVRGLLALVERLERGAGNLPIVQLVTGRPTTLRRLAEIVRAAGGGPVEVHESPPRPYDVARFWGDPSRSAAVLDWRAGIPIEDGMARLVAEYAAAATK
jgi:nucleoside-diphosphate-sugar epimerase